MRLILALVTPTLTAILGAALVLALIGALGWFALAVVDWPKPVRAGFVLLITIAVIVVLAKLFGVPLG